MCVAEVGLAYVLRCVDEHSPRFSLASLQFYQKSWKMPSLNIIDGATVGHERI